ncbi:AI-2E family transporter [Wenxinia saemankumensis]|uniref:Predicted PurR-regulated permease PerM n=1 Tax=Wenxinia saemankumensis TaxID=1447782 RepID=A0A1M6EW86_9RHOB|nr:AI-2E family transporter [Wenxinia saemankumensis]SHI89706.1 Predicted PurR-regulated permease PerM [Wenxinia saemankumensis]
MSDDSTAAQTPPARAETAILGPRDESLYLLRTIRRTVTMIFIILGLTAAYFSRDLLLPLVLGLLLTLVFSPLVRALKRIGIPAWISAVLLIGGLTVGAIAGGYALSGTATSMVANAPQTMAEAREKLSGILDTFERVQEVGAQVSDITDGEDGPADDTPGQDETVSVVADRPNFVMTAAGGVASFVSTTIAALVLALFLLASEDMFQRRIVETSKRLTDKKRAFTIMRDMERQMSRYLLAVTAINAGLGVCVGTALWALGLTSAPVWGVAAFLLNFIPFLGAAVGVVLVAITALVQFDSASYALLCPLAYLGLTTLEGNVVTPALVGRRLEINTVSVLVAVIVWVWLWGVPGAVLAVPILVVIKVICDNIERLQPIGRFLSGSN